MNILIKHEKLTSYKRTAPVLIITIALAIFWIIAENRSSGKEMIIDDVPELIFSRESGFYDDEFDLIITAPRGKVYYTTDGSVPTSDSIPYTEAIHIIDATVDENVYSARTDTSTGFRSDLISEYSSEDPGYMVPDYCVDKCTVIRAVVCYDDGSYSQVKTCSYFVGFNDKPGYEGMNYISVVTDPVNLFDYNEGIYVTGRAFDEYVTDIENMPWNDTWYLWTANYSRENTTEKPASVQFFDQKGNLLLSQLCGLKLKGNGSRGYVCKSLNLVAREEYDGNDHFIYDFWGDGFYPKRLSVFSGGDDYITKSRDYLIHSLCKDMEFATMKFTPYVMFLDGEYWGVYWLNDKYDAEYFNNRYGVDKDSVIAVKYSPRYAELELEEGEETDAELYYEMMDFCNNADMSIDENYRICFDKYLDYDSTIDYYAVMLYISRYWDWPQANFGLWRTKTVGNDNYSDGKWRWMMFDVNNEALSADLTDYDSIAWAMYYPFFANLMSNEKFRTDLLDCILELQYTTFSKASIEKGIQDYHQIMDEPLKLTHKRFWGTEDNHLYDESLQSLEYFLYQRPDHIDDIVNRYR